MLLLSISMAVFDAVADRGNGRMLLLTWLVQGQLCAVLTMAVLSDV